MARVSFEVDGLDSGLLLLESFEGSEGLSCLYEYTLVLSSPVDGGVADTQLETLLTAKCTLRYGESRDEAIVGVLRSFRLSASADTERLRYVAVFVPRLWRSTLSHRTRVFQDKTIPQIVASIMAEYGYEGVKAPWSRDSWKTYPYIAQYEETDFDFVSRLMETSGIFYFWVPGWVNEELVLGASTRDYIEPSKTVQYNTSGDAAGVGRVWSLSREHRVCTKSVTVQGYEPLQAAIYQGTEISKATAATGVHIVSRGMRQAIDDDNGRRLANIRAQAIRARHEVFRGVGNVLGIFPGERLEIGNTPALTGLNCEYLITGVTRKLVANEAGAQASYEASFDAIKSDTTYRAPLVTPKPNIGGVVYGRVVGAVEEPSAPVDLHGRYRIALPFDSAHTGNAAVHWVRMMQPSSGADHGTHITLNVGCEVAIAHRRGDPDEPIIVAALPNNDSMSPVDKTNPTQSIIRTRSGAEILFDDGVTS